jgi:hypothetical protein
LVIEFSSQIALPKPTTAGLARCSGRSLIPSGFIA